MYQIVKKDNIREEVAFCHEDGTTAFTVAVDIDIDEAAARVNKAYELLGAAENAAQKNPRSQDAIDAMGAATIALFEVIFGREDTAKIVDFYGSKPAKMLLDVFPFINDVVMPRIKAASSERRDQLVAAAKAAQQGNRADRRRRR